MAGDYSLEASATNKEHSCIRQFYIPLKNMKIKYAQSTSTGKPKFFDYGMAIVAYDAYGTAETDNIASYGWSYKLYFKDP